MKRFTIKLTIEVEVTDGVTRAALMDHCAAVLSRHMPAVIVSDDNGDDNGWEAIILSDTLQVTQRLKETRAI